MSLAAAVLAVAMVPAGGWNVKVEADGLSGTFAIDPPTRVEVKGERHPCLPPKTKTPFWAKECRFKAAYNPNLGAALSLILMVLVFICIGITRRVSGTEEVAMP